MIMRLLAGIVLMAAEMAVTAMVVVAPAPALVLMFNVSPAAAQDTDGREPVPMTAGPPSSLYSVDGLALGAKVPFGSAVYRQYRCVRSEKFEGFVWCTKTNDNREARGPFKVWFSMLLAQNGVAVYVNRYQEPVHWGANEIPEDIQRYSKKIGEQPHIAQLPTRAGAPRGTIATWGKVVLEPITGDALRALAEGKPPGEGIALDFIGDFARSARQGLPVYRIAGGAGFVWAGSYDERGRGTLRFSAVDASAYSPQALQPILPSVVAIAPDEKAPVAPSYSPQASTPPETTIPLPAVLPPGAVATAVEPPLSPPQTLPPQETIPPSVTPVPLVALAAGSNDEKMAPLGGTEPEMTNPKLDDQVGADVCRLVGFTGARFCADFMSVRYFVLMLVGLTLFSGVAMVRLAPTLKGYGPSTTLLQSDPSNHASEVKKLPHPQNSSVIVAADQKANAEGGGRFSTLATSPLFKRTMMEQRENSPGVTPNCWACGGNINATDRFCSACGVPSKIYSQVTSQTSSSELPSDTAFCPKCGGKVINAQVITSTDRSQEPTTMDAGVRNHHVAGLGSIATSTSITLDPESENPRLDEHFFAKVPGASEATLTDVKRLVAAAEHHIADVAARQEDEQLVAGIDDDGVSKMAPFGVGRLELKQTVEFARECARIDLDGGVGEIRPSASSRPTTLASGPYDLPSSSGR